MVDESDGREAENVEPVDGEGKSDDGLAERYDGRRGLSRAFKILLIVPALILLGVGGFFIWLDTDAGHRFIIAQIESSFEPGSDFVMPEGCSLDNPEACTEGKNQDNGLRVTVDAIDGSIFGDTIIRGVRVRDVTKDDPKTKRDESVFLKIDTAKMKWRWLDLVRGYVTAGIIPSRLWIDDLQIDQATLWRMPAQLATNPDEKTSPYPAQDIRFDKLVVDRLVFDKVIADREIVGKLSAYLDWRDDQLSAELKMRTEGSGDLVDLKAEIVPPRWDEAKQAGGPQKLTSRGRFDMKGLVLAPGNGVIASLAGYERDMRLSLAGKGDWQKWNGSLLGEVEGKNVAALKIGWAGKTAASFVDGTFNISGLVQPTDDFTGIPAQLIDDRLLIKFAGKIENKLITPSRGFVKSDVFFANIIDGSYDLQDQVLRGVRLDFGLDQPRALVEGLNAQNLRGRIGLSGALDNLAFDYEASATRIALDDISVNNLALRGRGAYDPERISVPIEMRASLLKFGSMGFQNPRGQVTIKPQGGRTTLDLALAADDITGAGDIGERIYRNLRVDGTLAMEGSRISGEGVRISTDQVKAVTGLVFDMDSGNYRATPRGTVSDFAIDGFGVVDLAGEFTVAPGAGGIAIDGSLRADMDRLDNDSVRTLTGGLPRMSTQVSYGADEVFRFSNFRITSPKLTFAGNGLRRQNGVFDISGSGVHSEYGPIRMTLAGLIDRPKVRLVLARPYDAAGLANVTVDISPSGNGFAIRASGGSLLGEFSGNANLVLGRGDPTLQLDQLEVAGTTVTGDLRLGDSLSGDFTLSGNNINGTVALSGAAGGGQRFIAELVAKDATLAGVYIGDGTADVDAVFGAGQPSVDATILATNVRYQSTPLDRVEVKANIVNGSGDFSALAQGPPRSGFGLSLAGDLRLPNGNEPLYAVFDLNGELEGRTLTLDQDAVIVGEGDGYRLRPVKIRYSGGELTLGALFGGKETAFAADLDGMPLQILDFINPDLGLYGRASGLASYRTNNGRPESEIALRINDFARSGLILTSTPVDIGLNASLADGRLAMRSRIWDQGKRTGEIQARITGIDYSGSILENIRGGRIELAEAIYDGRVESLWRLTGIDLFDFTGQMQARAEITGTLNDPTILGRFKTDGARMESATTGTVVTGLVADGVFDGRELRLTSFTGATEGDGKVSGSGVLDLSRVFQSTGQGTNLFCAFLPTTAENTDGERICEPSSRASLSDPNGPTVAGGVGIDLTINADNALLLDTDTLSARMTGSLKVLSNGVGGLISGKVTLPDADFVLGAAAEELDELPDVIVQHRNRPEGQFAEAVPEAPWRLDVDATAVNSLDVTGLGLDSIWSAQLKVGGSADQPVLLGDATLSRGEFSFAGRNFELDEGEIRFVGASPVNPIINVVANANVGGTDATVTVSGRGQAPQIAFTSTSGLPQEELLSRLLFGDSVTNISATEALQLAAAVASLQGGGGGLDPINALRDAAGLDRLRFVQADELTGQGTAIAAGKYLGSRFYAELITDGQGYSATQVEFQITRWLSILSSISTLGRQSINVRFSKDY